MTLLNHRHAGELHVATTLSLTSLLSNPSAGGCTYASCGPLLGSPAPAHGEYVPPGRQLPSAVHRTAGRAAAVPPRRPVAPFEPPSDAEDVPESVRVDLAAINTMHIGRRTSSRWSEYARDGAPWAPEEEVWLLRHHRAGCPPDWLSSQLCRTKSAVKARLKRHQDRAT